MSDKVLRGLPSDVDAADVEADDADVEAAPEVDGEGFFREGESSLVVSNFLFFDSVAFGGAFGFFVDVEAAAVVATPAAEAAFFLGT